MEGVRPPYIQRPSLCMVLGETRTNTISLGHFSICQLPTTTTTRHQQSLTGPRSLMAHMNVYILQIELQSYVVYLYISIREIGPASLQFYIIPYVTTMTVALFIAPFFLVESKKSNIAHHDYQCKHQILIAIVSATRSHAEIFHAGDRLLLVLLFLFCFRIFFPAARVHLIPVAVFLCRVSVDSSDLHVDEINTCTTQYAKSYIYIRRMENV